MIKRVTYFSFAEDGCQSEWCQGFEGGKLEEVRKEFEVGQSSTRVEVKNAGATFSGKNKRLGKNAVLLVHFFVGTEGYYRPFFREKQPKFTSLVREGGRLTRRCCEPKR